LFIEYGYGLVNSLGRLLFRYQLNDRLVVETTSGVINTVDLVYSRKKQ
jgi:autotransporter translocation and assembly factor TamB